MLEMPPRKEFETERGSKPFLQIEGNKTIIDAASLTQNQNFRLHNKSPVLTPQPDVIQYTQANQVIIQD